MGMCFLSYLIPLLILALPRKHGIRKLNEEEEEEEEAWKMQQGPGAREHRRCCPSIL